MSSRLPDVPAGAIPDDFDLDVRFGERPVREWDFGIQTLAECPEVTQRCPGTACYCLGASGTDTCAGPTCRAICGATRSYTCDARCIRTVYPKGCGTVGFTRGGVTCQTCFTCLPNACGGGGTNTPECG